jgi:hypothetical protein
MNKHFKIALLVAPFLIVLGYIVSDYYLLSKAPLEEVYQLNKKAPCDVISRACIFVSGPLELKLYDFAGTTKVQSNLELVQFNLLLVRQPVQGFNLQPKKNLKNFELTTSLRQWLEETQEDFRIRIIARQQKVYFIGEFSLD